MRFKNFDKEILHYGVKGMRWGVRRQRGEASADAKRHGANKKKKLSELSDDDLRVLVNRMNMEQNARRLNPNTLQTGHNAVKAVLAVGLTANAAIQFAQSPAGKAMSRAMAKAAAKATSIPVDQIGRTK